MAIKLFPKYFNAIRNRADAKKAKGDNEGACADIKLAAFLGDVKAKGMIDEACNGK